MGLISNFGKYVDKKFPDKVVVTEENYISVCKELARAHKEIAEQDLRLKNICKEMVILTQALESTKTDLNKIKLGMSFKAMGLSPAVASVLQ
jgi:hypothetical protein